MSGSQGEGGERRQRAVAPAPQRQRAEGRLRSPGEGRVPASPLAAARALIEAVDRSLGAAQRDWLADLVARRLTASEGAAGAEAPDGGPASSAEVPRRARAASRLEARDLRRQANIEAVLSHAAHRLSREAMTGEPASREVAVPWLDRLFAHAADCDSAARRELWALALATETQHPGSLSLRALDGLAALEDDELELLAKFARFSLGNFVVRADEAFFTAKGVTADDILVLEELGLVRTNRDISKVFRSQRKDSYSTHLLYLDKVLRLVHEDPEKTLTLPSYRLTRVGGELAELVATWSAARADTDYAIEIVRLASRQGFQAFQADILARAGRQVVTRHSPFFEIITPRRFGR